MTAHPHRFLFVHAHPDDETLATGLTMAHLVAAGHDVHVLTCTLGEEGEVIPPALAHLASDRDDRLGPWRREELRRAMARLGVSHSVLGEDPSRGLLSRYRDSGMAGMPSSEHPAAFVRADPAEAEALVAGHVAALRPDVVVTYDEHGGYGHPDHIQTHRVTLAALASLRGREAGPEAFVILTPRSWALEDRAWLRAHLRPTAHLGPTAPLSPTAMPNLIVLEDDSDMPPSVVEDDLVTHAVEDPSMVARQAAALAEHATQVTVFDGYYALSNDIAARLPGREGFAAIDPATRRLLPARPGRERVAATRHTGVIPRRTTA